MSRAVDQKDQRHRKGMKSRENVLRAEYVRSVVCDFVEKGIYMHKACGIYKGSCPTAKMLVIIFSIFKNACDFLHIRLPVNFSIGNLADNENACRRVECDKDHGNDHEMPVKGILDLVEKCPGFLKARRFSGHGLGVLDYLPDKTMSVRRRVSGAFPV